ncbi:MAG TPA: TMEM198/TM7SF3 family protein [candidate division Zixibacteria bacterium]|nr:TMEM198/TM7SF3 family protein [candidate division Zixibacteria bacterium]
MNYATGIIYVLAGIILLLWGYKLYAKTIKLAGFLIGAVFGFVVFTLIGLTTVFSLIGALIFGVLGIFFARSVEIALFLSVGALLGAIVGMGAYPLLTQFPQALVIFVFAVVGAALSLLAKRPTMIAGTSLAGATLTVLGVSQLITNSDMWAKFKNGQLENQEFYLIVIVALALVGAIVQVSRRKK